jgi:3,4-dihydroxy-2-butanone 4-phosphate synthase
MNNFNTVEHQPLQTYNRCVVTANLHADQGRAAVEDYLEQFSEQDKIDMAHMYNLIKRYGTKRVKAMVTEGLDFSNDDYVGEDK